MDVLEEMTARYSVRKFKTDKVPECEIERLLRAANAAPTACDKQPQRLYVIESEEALQRVKKCTECHFDAPLAILIAYEKTECWKRSFDGKTSGDIDASIVTTHLMLEAWDRGIGSTWVMWFDPAAVRREFALPETLEPVAFLMMGYPDEKEAPGPLHAKRKPPEKTVIRL